MALSERRCEAVVRYLEHRLGIKNVSFEENAFAFLRPFVTNTTRAHKAENRRVEIFVK
jgi:flagellar motor protein MotB